MSEDARTDEQSAQSRDRSEWSLPRRGALGLIGAAGLGAALGGSASANQSSNGGPETGNQPWYEWEADVDANGHDLLNLNALDVQHIYTYAREADVVVWKDDEGTFHADGPDGEVASGDSVLAVTQAAVDSLSEGRTSKEKVLITAPGEIGSNDDPLKLPSYTILDVPVTLTVPDGAEAPLVVRANGAEEIEIQSLTVEGQAAGGIRLTSCSRVRLGDITLVGVGGDGIRIDGRRDAPRSTDIQIDRLYVENTGHHGLETYGVDRIQIDQVIGIDPASCVVLLNDTTDATVNSIVGKEPGVPPGYATFRVANGAHDVTVGEVVSRGGARGVFGVSECYDITVGEVNIVGARDQGILIQNCQNFAVDGGVVKNSNDAVRIDTRDDGDQIPAEGVSITNLRVVDDREEKQQTYGIHETGPRTNQNRFVNNDVRDAGTEADIAIFSDSTVVRDNVGGGVDAGTVTLTSGASPAARVEGVLNMERSALDARAEPTMAGTGETYAWETYFEWNGGAGEWDMIFEWRTDPGTDIEVDYIVDKTR